MLVRCLHYNLLVECLRGVFSGRYKSRHDDGKSSMGRRVVVCVDCGKATC